MAYGEGGGTIVVSNRGPVTFSRGESGEREHSRNPYAIHATLVTPEEERVRRSRALRDRVMSNTIEDWVEAQMRDIEAYREQHG
ncbi:MAG: hypothetical protein H0U55_10940 [Rubrobacteraceae bacterium]|nr:hypothetical protein [Rubrobacteraceae bacterium]